MRTTTSSSKVLDILFENPEFEKSLRYAVEWEENPENKDKLGWSNWDIHTPSRSVNKLIYAEIAEVSYRSANFIHFRLMDREAVKEALVLFEAGRREVAEEKAETPPDLFSVIVGYDDLKEMMLRVLGSERPVGFLLVGPVATAKSLFLEELNRIPGSSYHLGSTATKAGLTQFLLNFRPRILLLDELEKMSREDFAALLSLMESGKVVETKFGRRSEEHMRVWVFAACNALKGIPPENLSRFPFRFHLREYTPEEYAQVAVRVLTEREGLDQGLAEYIAGKLSPVTRDVRKAVGLGRVCSTREEVDRRIKILRKYEGLS